MSGYDARLRIRLWVDAKLVDEAWVDTSNPDSLRHFDAIMMRQLAVADQAALDGGVWLQELYDPAKPHDQAYTRVGTDSHGMVDPRPL
jgi:hypothetical protein